MQRAIKLYDPIDLLLLDMIKIGKIFILQHVTLEK